MYILWPTWESFYSDSQVGLWRYEHCGVASGYSRAGQARKTRTYVVGVTCSTWDDISRKNDDVIGKDQICGDETDRQVNDAIKRRPSPS